MEAESEETKKREKANKKENKKRVRDLNKPDGNASIRSMFGNVVAKKKEKVNIDEDDILADILGEINPELNASTNKSTDAKQKTSIVTSKMNEKTEMALVKDYIANFSKAGPRKREPKTEATDDVSVDIITKHFFINFLILN